MQHIAEAWGTPDREAVLKREYEVHVATVRGEITSSLFGAVSAAGEDEQLAFDLADIFMWDVDFNTELQKGDSFSVAVEKLSLDGKRSRAEMAVAVARTTEIGVPPTRLTRWAYSSGVRPSRVAVAKSSAARPIMPIRSISRRPVIMLAKAPA